MEPVKQHFTFEMYSPTSYSESGIPVVDRVSVQMQGDDLPIDDIISKFEDFLKACGYGSALKDKFIVVLESKHFDAVETHS